MAIENLAVVTQSTSAEIIQFSDYQNKEQKLTKAGVVKKTHCNKEAGISTEVYAFKSKEEIAAIIDVLELKIIQAPTEEKKQIAYRNKLLVLVGMNIGIRASDIRLLKWSFFFNQDSNGDLSFKEFYALQPVKQKKQGKFVKLFFNSAIKRALYDYIMVYPIKDINSYIFMGREGQSITVQQMWNIIKGTAKEAGIEQNIGSHSLRKTWGYWCWHNAEDKNKALVTLQQCFNHNSTTTTLRYIGVLDSEISDMYNSVSLGYEKSEDEDFDLDKMKIMS